MMSISLFPVRAAMGRGKLPDGNTVDIYMATEFARALSNLLERVGGADGPSNTELQDLIKALELQAITFVDQIQQLFAADTALTDAVTAEQVSRAMDVDPVYRPQENEQLSAVLGMCYTMSQQLADLTLLVSVPERPPAIQKLTVTGAKGGNAALTSLLTALARSNIITDSTT